MRGRRDRLGQATASHTHMPTTRQDYLAAALPLNYPTVTFPSWVCPLQTSTTPYSLGGEKQGSCQTPPSPTFLPSPIVPASTIFTGWEDWRRRLCVLSLPHCREHTFYPMRACTQPVSLKRTGWWWVACLSFTPLHDSSTFLPSSQKDKPDRQGRNRQLLPFLLSHPNFLHALCTPNTPALLPSSSTSRSPQSV